MKASKLRQKARAQFTRGRIWYREETPQFAILTETPRSPNAVEVTLVRGRVFTRPQAARKHWSDA